MNPRKSAGPRSFAAAIRTKMQSADNPQGRPLSLRELSKAVDYSYEHVRKVLNGEPVVSPELTEKLCDVLGLNRDEMILLAQREKVLRRFGRLPLALLPPSQTPLDSVWPHLSEDDRVTLTRIASALAADNGRQRPDGEVREARPASDAANRTSLRPAGSTERENVDSEERAVLRLVFQSGASLELSLTQEQEVRAYCALQRRERGDDVPFVLIDAVDGRRYAINLHELAVWAFDYKRCQSEPGCLPTVRILHSSGQETEFEVEADEPDNWVDVGYLNYCFYMLETFVDDKDVLPLKAADDASWFFSPKAVAAFSAPIDLVGVEELVEE